MSQFRLYLKLKPFLREWLVHHFEGEPIEFPVQSVENATIRRFIQKLPKDKLPEQQKEDEVAILIPYSKAKPAAYYNYMGPMGKAALAEIIDDTFKRHLWNEIGAIEDACLREGRDFLLLKTIRGWMEVNGISINNEETVRQRYFRIREAYRRKGINLMKK